LIAAGTNNTDLEMPLREGDDFGIGGMIRGFDRDYSIADLWLMFANIFSEFGFRTRGSQDQDLAGIADGIQNLLEELLAFMDMPAADRIGFVMNMPRRHLGVKDNLIGAGKAEVKNAGLLMVDPDDGVEMMLHCSDPFVGRLNSSY
jgi:hypothetical protein